MTWEIVEGEAENLAALPAPDRLKLFYPLIADWGQAWGLKDRDGWILQRSEEGEAFPLWPHPDFAHLCATGQWEGTSPEPLAIEELLDDLFPQLAEEGKAVAAFPTPDDPGVRLPPAEVGKAIAEELEIGA